MRATPDLIEECARAPDDDEPRLVWADATGGERGELVVLQCDLARGGLTPHESGRRRKRVRDLLNQYGREWSGLRGLARRCTFRRGFVDAIEVDRVTDVDAIFAAAPFVQSVTVEGLAVMPPVPRLRALDCTAIADIAELRAIGTVLQTAEQLDLGRIERLWLRDFDGAALMRIFERAPHLTALRLDSVPNTAIEHLPPNLTELSIAGMWARPSLDMFLAEVARQPAAKTIERLAIARGWLRTNIGALGMFPKLRSLDLGDATIGDGIEASIQREAIHRLRQHPWTNLRELRVFSNLLPEEGAPWIGKLAPQLELLDLRTNSVYRDQSPLIDGDVVALSPSRLLITAGDRAPEPWWDRADVRF